MTTALAQQTNNYRAVRDRLLNPANASLPKRLEAAQAESAELRSQLEEANARLLNMQLDNSDLQATVMHQARTICELQGLDVEKINVRKPVKKIIESVLRDFPHVSWTEVISARRSKYIIEARHKCFVAVFTERPDLSYPAIGKIFNRDHTTIMAAVHKFKAQDARRAKENA